MTDDYVYQSTALPSPNIPGSDTFSPREFGITNPVSGFSPVFSTTQSPSTPVGGFFGGGGSGAGTVDLDLCDGSTVRVSGYVLPP